MALLDQIMPGATPQGGGFDVEALRKMVMDALAAQPNLTAQSTAAQVAPQAQPGVMPSAEQLMAGTRDMDAQSPAPQPLPAIESENIPTRTTAGVDYSAAPNAAPTAAPAPRNTETAPLAPPRAPAPRMERGFSSRLRDFGDALQGKNVPDAENQNATYQALLAKGLDATTARALVTNPTLMTMAPSLFSPKTQVINNRIVESSTGRVIADLSDTSRAGPEVKEITLPNGDKQSVVWNAQSNSYQPVTSTTPGTQPGARPVQTPQLGTQPTTQAGPGGNNLVAPLPVAPTTPETEPPPGVSPQQWRRTLATQTAEFRAKAITALPETLRSGDVMLRALDRVLENPNLSNVTGLNARLPTVRPSSQDVEADIGQIQGGTFLQAFNSLKGGGAISEREGQAATAAYNRLANLRQSDAGYRVALQEFRDEVKSLMSIARRNAGQGPQAPAGGGGDALSNARAAIARGAPRDAVERRLRDAGIDPGGL